MDESTDLLRCLETAESREAAIDRLAAIGPPAVAPLCGSLRHFSESVRQAASRALVKIGAPAVPELCRVLQQAMSERDLGTKWYATEALGSIADPSAVPVLLLALGDQDSTTRQKAAEALGRVRDPSSVTLLIRALSDHHRLVRDQVTAALVIIGDSTVPALCEQLRSRESRGPTEIDDTSVRLGAIDALSRIADPRAISPIIQSLRHSDLEVRRAAAVALERLASRLRSPELRAALPTLYQGVDRSGDHWEQHRDFTRAAAAIEAATRSLADLPITSQAPKVDRDQLPRPAHTFTLEDDTLPRADPSCPPSPK